MDSIYLTYMYPYQPYGKIKNEQAHAGGHTGRTSIRDVIVMLKRHHYVASRRIQEAFLRFFFFSI